MGRCCASPEPVRLRVTMSAVMKFRSRQTRPPAGAVSGPVRVDRRTSGVLRRAQARRHRSSSTTSTSTGATPRRWSLTACAAVVNARPFISGRYPNLGPEVLARAGVLLVEGVGPEVFGRLHDGDRSRCATALCW